MTNAESNTQLDLLALISSSPRRVARHVLVTREVDLVAGHPQIYSKIFNIELFSQLLIRIVDLHIVRPIRTSSVDLICSEQFSDLSALTNITATLGQIVCLILGISRNAIMRTPTIGFGF